MQSKAEFGGNGVVGPEPGGRDHLIGLHDQLLGLENVVALEVIAGGELRHLAEQATTLEPEHCPPERIATSSPDRPCLQAWAADPGQGIATGMDEPPGRTPRKERSHGDTH